MAALNAFLFDDFSTVIIPATATDTMGQFVLAAIGALDTVGSFKLPVGPALAGARIGTPAFGVGHIGSPFLI